VAVITIKLDYLITGKNISSFFIPDVPEPQKTLGDDPSFTCTVHTLLFSH
jgi:hypothetical protein